MDSYDAFVLGMANRGNEKKVFDWDKASRIIKESKPGFAVAGLSLDMEWTSGIIYENGKPVFDSYTFLSSTWATPVLVLSNGDEIECYMMESDTSWDEHTKWPESALKILEEE